LQFDLFERATKDLFSLTSYPEFKKQLAESNCSRCPELCQNRTTIVVDRGTPEANVVLIGEAPGENEDLRGEAFVGRAGQLLDKILSSVGLDTNRDTLILNVVKCRPPENRAPKPFEAGNCFPYLKWQLDFVKPKVIVLLGATAARYFLPKEKGIAMRDRVGTFFEAPEYPETKFMLLYHPAYILRDPRKKPEMEAHVSVLKAYLDQNRVLSI